MDVYVGVVRVASGSSLDDEFIPLYAAANSLLEAKGVLLDEVLQYDAYSIRVSHLRGFSYNTEVPKVISVDPDHISNVVPEYLRQG